MRMTYHDALAPRSRRPWLIALPLAITIALGVAWSALWFYARGEAEVRLADWQAQQAKGGRSFTCGTQTIGGFPFRIEVTCTDASVTLSDAQPPVALKLKQILAVAQVWDPKLIIAEFTGPMTASDVGGAPYATVAWTLARASVRGTPKAPERVSIVTDGLRLTGTSGPLFDSRHAEFHARMQFGSWPANPAIDLVANVTDATAPTVNPHMAQPFDADVLAVLHGMKDLSPKPLPVRLREWQAAGGKLEIQKARLAQGDALANTTGVLALSGLGRLEGTLQLAAAGIERYLPALGSGGGPTMSLERAAPALNAIERAVPGLGQRISPERQQSMQAGLLGLLGKPVDIEGKRGIAIPVSFQDGSASFGPIPVGKVPPLF
jgi:hypothetical protein